MYCRAFRYLNYKGTAPDRSRCHPEGAEVERWLDAVLADLTDKTDERVQHRWIKRLWAPIIRYAQDQPPAIPVSKCGYLVRERIAPGRGNSSPTEFNSLQFKTCILSQSDLLPQP